VLDVVADDEDGLDPPLLVGVEEAGEALDRVLPLVAEGAEDGEASAAPGGRRRGRVGAG
jgi:hypothetical protein